MLGPFSARDARTGQSVRVSVSPRSGLRLERRPVGDLGGDDSAPPAVENLSLLELAGWKCSPASPPDAAEPVVSLKLISGRLISLRCAAEAGRGLVQRLDAVTNQLAAAAAAQPAGDAWTAIRRHGPNHLGLFAECPATSAATADGAERREEAGGGRPEAEAEVCHG